MLKARGTFRSVEYDKYVKNGRRFQLLLWGARLCAPPEMMDRISSNSNLPSPLVSNSANTVAFRLALGGKRRSPAKQLPAL